MKSNKLVSFLLVLVMIVGLIPNGSIVIDVNAATTTISTRAQWVQQLTETFEMSIDENQYPDNYYSDIDEESEYYDAIMLATAFGVVDIEAGQPFNPDGAITREFAAHTLNFGMGYQLEDGETYTFSDSANCVYPDDAQIAINRGWFSTVSGKFSPTTTVTSSEIHIMLQDAEDIVESESVNENYDSTWDVADGVIEISQYVEVTVEEGTVVIVDSPKTINEGDTFVVYQGDIAVPFKAVNVIESDNITTITTEDIDNYEEAFDSVDAEGVIESDELTFEALDGTELEIITTESTEVQGKARATKKLEDRKFTKNFKLSGNLSSRIDGTLKNIKVKYNISTGTGETFVQIEGDLSMTGSIAATAGTSVELLKIGAPGVGGVTLTADLKGEGKLNSTITTHIVAGLSYTKSGGFRTIRSFKENGGSNTSTEATASMGVTLKCGITDMKVISGYVYAKAGVKAQIVDTTWTDGQPRNCKTFIAYMYASYGAEASCKFVNYKYEKSVDIYNLDNSPMRVYHHYEDGAQTATCARGQTLEYFTKYYSSYWGSGWSGFNGSYGLDGAGKPYQVYEYSLSTNSYGDKVAKITKYRGNIRNLTVPEQLDGYTVVGIGNNAFKNNSSLVSVVIPDTITSLGNNSFYECQNLQDVTLSDNLKQMGYETFGNCSNITSIEIPKTLTSCTARYVDGYYSNGPFVGTGIRNIKFAEGTEIVANGLFAGCSKISQIELPETITSIGSNAFSSCQGITEVSIPESITYIGVRAFENCTNLNSLRVGDNVTKIDEYTFNNCTSLSSVKLSKNIVEIGSGAFKNCTSLKVIEIPKSLTEGWDWYWRTTVGKEAPFTGSGLEEVTFEAGIQKIANSLLSNCRELEQINIPDTITNIGDAAFSGCTGLTSIVIPDSVTNISWGAFNGCSNLISVDMGNGVVNLTADAFQNCVKLKDIKLSKKLTTMGGEAFENCISLEEIEIPKSLNECSGQYDGRGWHSASPFLGSALSKVTFEEGTNQIVKNIFSNCEKLESIDIPETVTTIGQNAFLNCTNLKTVNMKEGVDFVAQSAFKNCALTSIVLPDTITLMGTEVFSGCRNLASVKLPSRRVIIMNNTFYNCSSLKNIEIPETVTTIRENAFQGSGLTSITLPDATTLIESSAFRNCESLESVTLGKNTQYIWDYAFSGCKSLKKIAIPDTIITLGQHIFDNCEVLEEVSLGNGLTEIPAYAFYQCPKITEIKLPYRVAAIKTNAFTNSVGLVSISIPRNTISIADNAFSYPEKLTIHGVAGTYAEEYANGKGIKFVGGDIPAENIVLSETQITLNKNATKNLILSISPVDFTDEVDWKSSDTSVVTVDATGKITAKATGTAFIKVTVGSQSVTCDVTVVQPVTSISINKTSLTLEAMEEYKLNATVYPDNANNKSVEWKSSNPEVATVDAEGNVTALAKGTASITVTTLDGSNISKSCTVTVKNNAYIVDDVNKMESEHPYGNNCTDVWSYTLQDANKLKITFSADTEMEDGFDYLYILDANNNQIGKYTGKEIAGQSIVISGNTVKIKLNTDSGGNAYGFKVDEIVAVEQEVESTTPPEQETTPSAVETTTPSEQESTTPSAVETTTPSEQETTTPSEDESTTKEPVTQKPDETTGQQPTKENPTEKPTIKPKEEITTNTTKPGKVSLKKLKNLKGKKVKVTWKKLKNISGYQIQYATNKKFKKGLKKTTAKATETSKTVNKLKIKKTYYFRIRAYKKVNGKKIYGKWSNVKKVVVKK